MPSQDLFSRVAVVPTGSSQTNAVTIGNSRVVRVRPSNWTGGMFFKVGHVSNSLGILSNPLNASITEVAYFWPTSEVEVAVPAILARSMGPWLQILGLTNQTGGANVVVTLDPRR